MAMDLFQTISMMGRLFRSTVLHPLWALETGFPSLYRRVTGNRRLDPVLDIPPGKLEGRVIAITGGNEGLGKETLRQIARHWPLKIFVLARDEAKALAVIEEINEELKVHEYRDEVYIQFVWCDLANLSSVRYAVDILKAWTDRLDILILNAGVMAMPASKTEIGFEIHLGVNHVGHYYLTKGLLHLMLKTAKEPGTDVRVVVVSSDAHQLRPPVEDIIHIGRLLTYNPLLRYAASKAANVLFAAEFARRFPEITCVSVHPGIVFTDLYKIGLSGGDVMLWMMKLCMGWIGMAQSVKEGALTTLWCAIGASKGELRNGGYYTVERLREWNECTNDKQAGKVLWEWTEKQLTKSGFGVA
jgi:NAD(P)-dependent dehydrogenase (short-subunit alcohol dehydrogenase family)